MSTSPVRSRFTWILALPLALGLGACHDRPSSTAPVVEPGTSEGLLFRPGHGEALKFMSRNVYLGADLNPVIQAASQQPPNSLAVLQAAAVAWQEVQDSRIPDRAAALAAEIERARPHLVGLQEVFGFVELDLTTPPPAPVQVLDLLAGIEAALDGYTTVAVQVNTATTIPVAADPVTGDPTRVVQLEDRIAVLARNDVVIHAVDHDNYDNAGTTISLPGLLIQRGWIRVDAELAGEPFHFVNTHLEVQDFAPIQAAQAAELQTEILTGLGGVTVLAGDLNSDAEGTPGDGAWTPTYGDLIATGFQDLWNEHPRGRRPGYTCCHAHDLRNFPPDLDRRLDFVLVKGMDQLDLHPPSVWAELVGDQPNDRTDGPDPLWPSDHAGVVVALGMKNRNGRPGRH